MKDIDNVVFTDEILEKYKDDSKEITELCKKLDDNKIFQKKYRKFLEGKERIIHVLEQENQQLKDELKNKPDTQITLQDDKGNKFTLIQTERIDIQVELNKTIEKLFNNWNKLKEYIDIKLYNVEYLQKLCGYRIDDEIHMILDIIKKKMQELEIGSDESGKNQC